MRQWRVSSGVQAVGLSILAIGTFSSTSWASSNADAKVLLHLLEATSKNPCLSGDATPSSAEIVTSGRLFPKLYNAYVLVTDADPAVGVACLQFGIAYDNAPGSGVDIFGWNNCAVLDFHLGDWPASGSGNMVCWDYTSTCQRNEPGGAGTGVVAVFGYFYCAAYTPGTLDIIPRPADGLAGISSCTPINEYFLPTNHLGFVSFSEDGTSPGYNPSEPAVRVESSTWSRIKVIAGN